MFYFNTEREAHGRHTTCKLIQNLGFVIYLFSSNKFELTNEINGKAVQ